MQLAVGSKSRDSFGIFSEGNQSMKQTLNIPNKKWKNSSGRDPGSDVANARRDNDANDGEDDKD